jgi:hypothetical protein
VPPEKTAGAASVRDRYFSNVARLADSVFRAHPELPDHRRDFPWLTACLGDPFTPVWFVAENPSLQRVSRSHVTSPEHQWSGTRETTLLREMLCKHGFKAGGALAKGGWRCYITDVVKSAAIAKDWSALRVGSRRLIAEAWAPVLRYELEEGRPGLVVAFGANAETLLLHLEREALIPTLPALQRIDHYSYIALRPDKSRRLGPAHPQRVAEWDAKFAAIADAVSLDS